MIVEIEVILEPSCTDEKELKESDASLEELEELEDKAESLLAETLEDGSTDKDDKEAEEDALDDGFSIKEEEPDDVSKEAVDVMDAVLLLSAEDSDELKIVDVTKAELEGIVEDTVSKACELVMDEEPISELEAVKELESGIDSTTDDEEPAPEELDISEDAADSVDSVDDIPDE
ncbi:hypothetical protein BT63DRAFT_477473 [Microthyrium microscopicum]|uniref:Uncharacterized protein n=1 Tax=Microthyrium microscopicum TaxID=703497 RepID=A0A6A6UF40_9PEZI|nr:hypothetical protein BT63DRAFT_477473 [Microthyrium microscopicum]